MKQILKRYGCQSGLGRERSRKVLGDANSEQLKGQLGIARKNRLSLIGTAAYMLNKAYCLFHMTLPNKNIQHILAQAVNLH